MVTPAKVIAFATLVFWFDVRAQPQLQTPPPYEHYAASTGEFSMPTDGSCYSTRRRVKLLSIVPHVNFVPYEYVLKADVLCIGDHIVFNTPVYTNGGSIFVFASKVTINAPIDTRLHLEQYPNLDPWEEANSKAWRATEHQERYMLNYQSYYTGCDPCEPNVVRTKLPRLPSGRIRKNIYSEIPPLAGEPPPDAAIDFAVAQSGSIYIATNELSIPSPPSKQPLLQVSGLAGGLGGPGAPPTCAGIIAGIFACINQNYGNGGTSGPGGRGGDAGNILLMGVGRRLSARSSEISSNSGGRHGPTSRLVSPPSRINGETYFVPVSQWAVSLGEDWPASLDGEDGFHSSTIVSLSEALRELFRFVEAVDADPYSDPADLVYRAAATPAFRNTNLQSFLVHRLSTAVLESQANFALDLHARFDGKRNTSQRPLWSVLRGVASVNGLQVRPESRQVLLQLASVDTPSGEGVHEYLARNGGAFAIQSPDAFNRYWQDVVLIDLSTQILLDSEQLRQLTEISRLTTEQLISSETLTLRQALQRAIEALAEAEKRARESKKPGLADLAKSIAASSKNLIALGTALSGDPGSTANLIGPATSSIQSLYSTLFATAEQSENIPRLRAAVTSAQQALDSFVALSSAARSAVIDRGNYQDLQSLMKQETLQARIDGRSAYILDLLRHTLVSYAADAARDTRTAKSNAMAIWTLASRFPVSAPRFQFSVPSRVCESGITPETSYGRCTGIEPSEQWRSVTGSFGVTPAGRWVLYSVAPKTGPYVLPNYGIQTEIESTQFVPFWSAAQE